MPNECDNDFYVRGPTPDIQRFIEKHVVIDQDGGAILDANSVIPYPDHFRELDRQAAVVWACPTAGFKPPKDGFNSGGYEWCVAMWGTKWGAYCGRQLKMKDFKCGRTWLKMRFYTAWEPFTEDFYQSLSILWPALTFENRFYERGMEFKGYRRFKNGERLHAEFGVYRPPWNRSRGG